MRASHKIVSVLGVITCFVMLVFFRVFAENVGADATDSPTVALWIYTPFAAPGERIAAKIFVEGGDGISVSNLEASIDGTKAEIQDKTENERRPSRQFDMGKRDIELFVLVPKDLEPGEHQLTFDFDGSCAGSDFSHACGRVHLGTTLDLGSTTVRLWSVLRALLAALVVWFGVRLAKRPVRAWLDDSGKAGGALASAFIPLFVVWGGASYSLFARPLAAGVGTASDVFFGVAMVLWVALLPAALIWKRKTTKDTKPSSGALRFVAEPPQAAAEERGYRDAAAKPPAHLRRTLDDLATLLRFAFQVRLRRSGNRLVPRWLWGAPVTFVADDAEDITRTPLRVTGDYGYILIFAVKIAAQYGPLDLEIDGKVARVEKDASAQAVAASLKAPASVT